MTLSQATLRTIGPNIDLFGLILMHFSYWFQWAQYLIYKSELFENFLTKNCPLHSERVKTCIFETHFTHTSNHLNLHEMEHYTCNSVKYFKMKPLYRITSCNLYFYHNKIIMLLWIKKYKHTFSEAHFKTTLNICVMEWNCQTIANVSKLKSFWSLLLHV